VPIAPRAPDDADCARRNQGQADALLEGESFFQDHGGEYRHHQRHHAGKQRAGMGGGRKQQTGIHQQDHRRPAAGPDAHSREAVDGAARVVGCRRLRHAVDL
jgi:hypothetical protein